MCHLLVPKLYLFNCWTEIYKKKIIHFWWYNLYESSMCKHFPQLNWIYIFYFPVQCFDKYFLVQMEQKFPHICEPIFWGHHSFLSSFSGVLDFDSIRGEQKQQNYGKHSPPSQIHEMFCWCLTQNLSNNFFWSHRNIKQMNVYSQCGGAPVSVCYNRFPLCRTVRPKDGTKIVRKPDIGGWECDILWLRLIA